MRKLASIQQVRGIIPIPGADMIELVQVLGWQCVAKKGEFQVGDKGVYFEVDSFLPIEERFEFLRKSSYKKNELQGEGFRVKTVKLRGELSQGIMLPMELFPEAISSKIGDDVSDALDVRKWDPPETVGSMGTGTGGRPYGIPKTDETRIQSTEEMIELFKGKSYYITTKMDGTSCTMYVKDGKFGVCGRNEEYKEGEDSPMWRYALEHGIKDNMIAMDQNMVIQGEFCGPGIQGNKLKLKKPELYIFNVIDMDEMKPMGLDGLIGVTDHLDISRAPIEEIGESFDYELDELLDRAKGKYDSGMHKEGIVVRTQDQEQVNRTRMSFKVINNDFLLKEK